EGDGGADARERVDHVEEDAPVDAGVGAGTDDVVGVVQDRAEQDQRGDGGDEGDQVEDTGDESGPADHVKSPCTEGSASIWVRDSSGRPMSRSRWSSPCRAAWSTTGPSMTVTPSLAVRVIPSNQAVHRGSRCPWRRISYRLMALLPYRVGER